MPLQKLSQRLWKSVWNRNQSPNGQRAEKETLMAIGRHYGYSRGEVGYAIQLLKADNKLQYYPRSGWCAKR